MLLRVKVLGITEEAAASISGVSGFGTTRRKCDGTRMLRQRCLDTRQQRRRNSAHPGWTALWTRVCQRGPPDVRQNDRTPLALSVHLWTAINCGCSGCRCAAMRCPAQKHHSRFVREKGRLAAADNSRGSFRRRRGPTSRKHHWSIITKLDLPRPRLGYIFCWHFVQGRLRRRAPSKFWSS